MTNQDELKSLPLPELFELISANELYSTQSQRAYKEFEERYKQLLWNLCHKACLIKGHHSHIPHLDKDVYMRSMQEIYLKAGTFKAPGKRISKHRLENLLIGWFSCIAETVKDHIIAEHCGYEKMHFSIPGYEEYLETLDYKHPLEETENEKHPPQTEQEKALAEARKTLIANSWTKLSKREQDILAEYLDLPSSQKYLKSERINYLCTQFGITPDNLLHIKQRALKKIKKLCTDEQTQTEDKALTG